MFLQSVTLRGFKSFADKTTLDFEPGITVVVGPNGSGKSNIVDALTWVLGTHSAKALRGGSMADVIFAGSPGRPALGRAAVEIRIDNSAGSLPIEFSEVTVSRSMYASGESEYAINGVSCRMLDVAELLSDTGLGRENHTIVGQGRLDQILNARPEERRTFIEEAAGILKHRRRKERSLRKLAQMEDHLERSADLLRELRRQLRPLERQAEAAAKHAELRQRRDEIVRIRLLRDYDRACAELADVVRLDEASAARVVQLARELEGLRQNEAAQEAELAASEPRAREIATTHVRLSTATERFRGLVGRIDERRRGLIDAVEEPVAGRDPERLRADADIEEQNLRALDAELAGAQAELDRRSTRRADAERVRRAHEQAAAAEARRRREARERQLRWEGQVSALRSALAQAAGEEGRLSAQIAGLEDRFEGLSRDVAHAREEIRGLDAAAPALAARLAEAEQRLVRRIDIVDDLTMAERDLERERASLRARADALRAAAAHADDGAAEVLAAADDGRLDGVVGPLSSQVRVSEEMGPAVAQALERLGGAIVVDTSDHAHAALRLARDGAGPVVVVSGAEAEAPRDVERDAALAAVGASPVLDAVAGPDPVRGALSWALRDVYVVDDLDAAARLRREHPECVFVTPDGESAGARGWAGGARGEPTRVLALAGAEDAERRLAGTEEELRVVHRRLADADRERDRAREEVDAATVVLQESDGAITAAAERLRRLEAEMARCERELAERRTQAAGLSADMADRRSRLEALEADGVDEGETEPEGPDLEAERLDDALADAREAEVEARLETRSVQGRRAETQRRISVLRAEADDVERQLAAREDRRRARLAAVERCTELLSLAEDALDRASVSLAQADAEREAVDAARASRREQLGALRARIRERDDAAGAANEQRHETALSRQGLESAVAALRERFAELDEDLDPDVLLAAERQALEPARQEADGSGDTPQGRKAAEPADGGPLAGNPLAGGEPRDAELEAAQRRVERQLALIGDVNPLARMEYERLTERHSFMETELADVRATRDDLLEVVDAVDARIREVFAAAFTDVATAFDRILPRLFPGGEGQLVLTDPDDLLETGVEVEIRPAGKRVKRLSLLSGGERSLAALAITFAIFVARPSPFYVLDEVEAALDDVNLQRFLDVVAEFRHSSQVILVSHQKRTMEVADLLYGVTMQAGGVSRVVSQRATELVASG